MTASPSPHGVISHNVLFNAENGRGIKLGPGGADGGAVNVTVRFNTIYNSSQNVSLSRDTTGVRPRAQHPRQGARVEHHRASSCTASANVARENIARRRAVVPRQDRHPGQPPRRRRQPALGAICGSTRSAVPGFHPAQFKSYGARSHG